MAGVNRSAFASRKVSTAGEAVFAGVFVTYSG